MFACYQQEATKSNLNAAAPKKGQHYIEARMKKIERPKGASRKALMRKILNL